MEFAPCAAGSFFSGRNTFGTFSGSPEELGSRLIKVQCTNGSGEMALGSSIISTSETAFAGTPLQSSGGEMPLP